MKAGTQQLTPNGRAPKRSSPDHEVESAQPMVLFRKGVYMSLGVLAVVAAVMAVYTARAVLIRALIALFLAISLDPAVRWLIRWTEGKHSASRQRLPDSASRTSRPGPARPGRASSRERTNHVAWLLVIVPGLFETSSAVLLKQSHGITEL